MQLGDKMRSVVTGLEGIATAYVLYLNGCERFLLQQPVDPDGKEPEPTWIDIQELEVTSERAVQLPRSRQAPPLRIFPPLAGTGGGENPPTR